MSRAISIIQALTLISIAVAGILIGVLDFAGHPFPWFKDAATYILLLISLLTLNFGLDHFTNARRTENRLDEILGRMKLLEIAYNREGLVHVMDGYDEVYDVGCQSIADAKRQIRAVVSVGGMTAPEKYRNKLAEVLIESKETNRPIHNDIIFSVDKLPLAEPIRAKFKERNKYYKQKGIFDLIHLHVPPTPMNFDLLIVDERHVMISFTVVRNATKIQTGLAFINQPKIGAEMSKWYDNVLMQNVTPLEEVLNES